MTLPTIKLLRANWGNVPAKPDAKKLKHWLLWYENKILLHFLISNQRGAALWITIGFFVTWFLKTIFLICFVPFASNPSILNRFFYLFVSNHLRKSFLFLYSWAFLLGNDKIFIMDVLSICHILENKFLKLLNFISSSSFSF